jgi:hypothetical protein
MVIAPLRTLTILVVAVLTLLAPAAEAKKKHPKPPQAPRMQLLSKAGGGGMPNGASHNGVFAQDRQLASLAAFDSDASNIVRGDTNGFTDVFLVRRKRPYSDRGEPWVPGKTSLISRARDGGPANGRSYQPDIDGEQSNRPRCIAFISEASNLVPGDTNGVADAFVKNLKTGRLTRVSVNSAGQQADGPTTEVKIDGHCERVAFVANATNLALTATNRLAWKSAVTAVPAPGTSQVYVRVIDRLTDNAGITGLTFLASAATGSGQPGNGNSYDLSFARGGGGCGRQNRCGSFSGEAVFFASDATNLSSADTDPGADVYRRSFNRGFVRIRFPHERRVDGEKVRSTLVGVGPLRMSTRLMSVNSNGERGNGPSDQPAATDSGHFVAFRTSASNLLGRDRNGQPDVVRLNTATGDFDAVSRTRRGKLLGNGPSGKPAIGRTGEDIVFESSASNFDANDKNCAGDIYHLDFPANNQILSSLDSRNHVPNAPFGTPTPCPAVVAAPISNPRVSYYLNYMLLESSYVLLDRKFAKKTFRGVSRSRAARMSHANPTLQQVYLRYLSPR